MDSKLQKQMVDVGFLYMFLILRIDDLDDSFEINGQFKTNTTSLMNRINTLLTTTITVQYSHEEINIVQLYKFKKKKET